jgi:small subunit ribosomal protein S18
MYINTKRKNDYFYENQIPVVDYKDTRTLSKFMNQHGRIQSRSRTMLTSKHQREVAQAVKRARFMGLLPYISY